MAGRAFLDSGARPSDAAIREAIAGNLCRCTGYTKIVEAIERVALAPGWEGGSRLPRAAPAAEAGLGPGRRSVLRCTLRPDRRVALPPSRHAPLTRRSASSEATRTDRSPAART